MEEIYGKDLKPLDLTDGHMHRQIFHIDKPEANREKNLVLILLAVLVALVLWSSFWLLVKLALFGATVFGIYVLLRRYL
jgi:hypothetical protein